MPMADMSFTTMFYTQYCFFNVVSTNHILKHARFQRLTMCGGWVKFRPQFFNNIENELDGAEIEILK